MLSRTRPIISNLACGVFKRCHTTLPVQAMEAVAESLVKEKRYKSAQNQYEKIMDAYPNYAIAYDKYFHLQLKTVGPFGLTQDLFDHLQKKYLEAVDKYGEYKEEPTASPKV